MIIRPSRLLVWLCLPLAFNRVLIEYLNLVTQWELYLVLYIFFGMFFGMLIGCTYETCTPSTILGAMGKYLLWQPSYLVLFVRGYINIEILNAWLGLILLSVSIIAIANININSNLVNKPFDEFSIRRLWRDLRGRSEIWEEREGKM